MSVDVNNEDEEASPTERKEARYDEPGLCTATTTTPDSHCTATTITPDSHCTATATMSEPHCPQLQPQPYLAPSMPTHNCNYARPIP